MRTAIEHLEAAIRELQERVSAQEITPETATELSEKLYSVSEKLSLLEERLNRSRDAGRS